MSSAAGAASGPGAITAAMARNVALYRWFTAFRSLIFSQAVWFFVFSVDAVGRRGGAALCAGRYWRHCPRSGLRLSVRRPGRRITLLIATVAGLAGLVLLATGNTFATFGTAQLLIGAGQAFMSGTDRAL